MAQLSSNGVIDTRQFELSAVVDFDYFRFFNDRPESFDPNDLVGMTEGWSVIDTGVYWSGNPNVNFATSAFIVGGDGLTIDANNVPTGGTVTGFLSVDSANQAELYFFLVNTTVSAVAMYQAVVSTTPTDDQALLRAMLAANDLLTGSDDNDYMAGWTGNDSLLGGRGDDTLAGENGADSLSGEQGNDSLAGGNSGDVLFGGDGRDTLSGGIGGDKMTGGLGTDVLAGGVDTNRDIFIFNAVEEFSDRVSPRYCCALCFRHGPDRPAADQCGCVFWHQQGLQIFGQRACRQFGVDRNLGPASFAVCRCQWQSDGGF